jgi:hypothetical protein
MPGPGIDLTHGRTLAGGVPQSAAVQAPWAQPRAGAGPTTSMDETPFRIPIEPQVLRANVTPPHTPEPAPVEPATPPTPPRKSLLRRLFRR